jgi:putative membrane protein
MKEFIRESLGGFPPFIVYFLISAVLLLVFLFIYLRVTPYREIALIKEGNAAAAASLSGALIGFTLPLAHAVAQSANLVDMLIWALIALVVQLASLLIVRALIPGLMRDIPEGKVAQGVFLGAVSIAAGILNAACMAD